MNSAIWISLFGFAVGAHAADKFTMKLPNGDTRTGKPYDIFDVLSGDEINRYFFYNTRVYKWLGDNSKKYLREYPELKAMPLLEMSSHEKTEAYDKLSEGARQRLYDYFESAFAQAGIRLTFGTEKKKGSEKFTKKIRVPNKNNK